MNKEKVFLGLSGGVDSAVSALLLKQAGYDVTGVFIKVWQPDFLPCTWRAERRDAMRIALALDIPFLFFDFEEEYKKGVAEQMIEEYRKGRTPNPDVLCNREVKFGAFWKKAKMLGADYIATGHYARNGFSPCKGGETEGRGGQDPSRALPLAGKEGTHSLQEGADKNKDQSYFLWTLTQEDLAHTLFPIGHLEKGEVRKLAKKFKLPVAEKKDSQGICFIGEVSIEDFLSRYISLVPGDVLDTEGKVIGRHKGALLYTFGERHGFEVTKKNSNDGAYFVIAKNMKNNTITVSNKEKEIVSLSPKEISIKNINWIQEPSGPSVEARIRYRQEKIPVTLTLKGKKLVVEFSKPARGLSPGQSTVFYKGDMCLGGAVIDEVLG